MNLRVHYTAQLRALVGRGEQDVQISEGSSLVELLERLAATLGQDARPHLLTDGGQARPSLLMVVNGSAVSVRDAAATVLNEGDAVLLLPPIAGG